MTDRKDICDSDDAIALMKKFNLKRVVAGRGHDCGGLLADLCIGSRVIAIYTDDGWGGDAEIRFTSDKDEAKAKDILTKGNFAQLMHDNGWSFYDTVNEIDFEIQVTCLVEALGNLKHIEKVMRSTKNKLLFGSSYYSYATVSWPKLKNLRELPLRNLQGTYDKYKKRLKKGQSFLNSDEQLLGLGIKL